MTTVEEARQNEDSYMIIGKLVTKRVYCKPDGDKLLSFTMIDSAGTLFDVQTWKKAKIFTLFRKLNPDDTYILKGKGNISTPNKQFSTSRYLIRGAWWIEFTDKPIRLKRYINCSTNLNETIETLKNRPENILGQFVGVDIGPKRGYAVQGWFVSLMDDQGKHFRVLVWHVVSLKGNKFAILDADPGDDVLITCVRPSFVPSNAEGGDRIYTVTSLVPPVLNSRCVSNKSRQKLSCSY